MKNLSLIALPFILISTQAAGASPPSAYAGMRADITKTLKELEEKANFLNANGNACSNNYDANKQCPQVAGAPAARPNFMAPLKSDIEAVKKFLNDKLTKVENELGKGIDPEELKKVTACSDGGDVAMKSEESKKAALDAGSADLQKILENKSEKLSEKGLKLKLADLHRSSPEFTQRVKACAGMAGSMFTLPNTPHELLVEVFKATMSSPGKCPANAVNAYHAIGDQNGLLAKLASQLDALNTQMKKDSATVAAVMAKTKPVASTCDTQAGKDAVTKAEKDSKVSGDTKPAVAGAKSDKATVTGQAAKTDTPKVAESVPTTPPPATVAEAKTKENSASAVADDLYKEVPPDQAKATTQKPAEAPKSVFDTGSSANYADVSKIGTTPKVDSPVAYDPEHDNLGNGSIPRGAPTKPMSAEEIASADAINLGEGAPSPKAGVNTGAVQIDDRSVASVDSNSIRNTYQKSQFFQSRDLDLYSKKDTTYIQQALNQVNGNSGVAVDGAYGKQTAAALDAVMKDPAKKVAFANALRGLMK